MIYAKTQTGQQVLKDRHGTLTPRQRTAFILFDGKRTLQQVLEATAAMGITGQDVQSMVDLGLLEAAAGQAAAPGKAGKARDEAGVADAAETAGTDAPASTMADDFRNSGDRYQEAYRIATELASGLGLRGLPLTLAVEAASGYRELLALAPKIRAAVGEAKYARLDQALNG